MGSIKPASEKNEPQVFGEVCIRKQRRKRQKLLLNELLYEYAKNSTLHGLRYIVDRSLRISEKIFWFLTFLMSIGLCFYLISNVYLKWKNSPVIVSFSEKIVPVGDVPFPSITICPQIKTKANVYNYSEIYTNYTDQEKRDVLKREDYFWHKLEDIDMVCGLAFNVKSVRTKRKFADFTMVENLIEVAPTIDDVLLTCLWRGDSFPCEKLFKRVITSEGICFNFNGLPAHRLLRMKNLQKNYSYIENDATEIADWSITEGYTKFRPNVTYPRRGQENVLMPDLDVILQIKPNHEDRLCNVIKSGWTIYVQHPADIPQASLYYYAALPGQVSSLALKFSKVSTDVNLKEYSPNVRQCYFPTDVYLKYFQIYTPSNCKLECQSNYTFAKCHCVAFHMPHDDSQHICINETSKACVKEALDNLSIAELDVNHELHHTRSCKCLPSCESVQYDAEILKTNFNVISYLKEKSKVHKLHSDDLDSFILHNFSRLEFYFKEPRFISMRRSELFGVTDFLANCGGLLGLFLGFSFLSLVEIIYFVTLRLYTILRRDLKEEKKGSLEKQRTEQEKY